jgi:hypothetical protein
VPPVTSEQSIDVRVEFGNFCLQEADEEFVPQEYPDGQDSDDPFLTPHEGRIDVRSAGHTHVAALIAQVWEGEPPPDGGGWEISGESELYSETGELSLWCHGGPTLGSTVGLGSPGMNWRVRVYSKGRAEVARLAEQGVPHHVELYLAQFWPRA